MKHLNIERASKTRILVCIDSFYDGGAEMFAIRLANNLAADAVVYFLALRPWLTKENKQAKLLDTNRVSVIELTGNVLGDFVFRVFLRLSRISWLGKMRQYAMDWRLRFVCKKYRIQIVNSHSWNTDKAFAAVKNRGSFRLVSSFHGHYELPGNSAGEHAADSRRQLHNADAVVYLSPRHADTLDGYAVPVSKRHKIFYGIPIPARTQVTTYQAGEKLKLVMAGRGIPEKGWAEVLEAVDEIVRDLGDVITIDLVGIGEELSRLRHKYRGHRSIRFLGYSDDVMSIIQEAHIGMLPSCYAAESLPNVVIEYLICGKPVIATDVGAIREMMTYNDEVAGIVLPLIDQHGVSPAQIRDAILDYLRHADKVVHDSNTALRAARKFEMHKCVESYQKLYNGLVTHQKP